MRILLLCQYDPYQAEAVRDHIDSLAALPGHEVDVLSFGGDLPDGLTLEYYDALVVHYSAFIYENRCLSPLARWRIRRFGGLKAAFLHDEYKHVALTIRALRYLGIHILFTVVPEHAWPHVYPREEIGTMKLVQVLTGYVPDRLVGLSSPSSADRLIDIGYRGRVYPAWHGRAGLERVRIAEQVRIDAPRHALRVDIELSEGKRLYGRRWTRFLASCRAVLGTESDVSVIDRTGEIARRVEAYRIRNPHASYEELRERFFASEDGKISIAQISPRIFEGIAMRTLHILYEGRYSDVIRAGVHYVPLRRDHSNFEEITALLKDSRAVDAITERAYTDVIASGRWSYASFGAKIASILESETGTPGIAAGRRDLPCPPRRLFGNYRSPFHRHVLYNRCRHQTALLFERIAWQLGEGRRERLKDWVKALARRSQSTGAEQRLRPADALKLLHANAAALAQRLGEPTLQIELDPVRSRIVLRPAAEQTPGIRLQAAEGQRLLRTMAAREVFALWAGGDALGLAAVLLFPQAMPLASPRHLVDTEAALLTDDILPVGWDAYAYTTTST